MRQESFEKLFKIVKVVTCFFVAILAIWRGQTFSDAGASLLIPMMTVGFGICLSLTAFSIALSRAETD